MTDQKPSPEAGLEFLDSLEQIRETMRGTVAAFVADGFTDEQARIITLKIFVKAWDS